MVTYAPGLLAKQNAQADHAKLARALTASRGMVAVPFEWHTAQTVKAVCFASFGWVPKTAIRWRNKKGEFLTYDCGREGDELFIASEFVHT